MAGKYRMRIAAPATIPRMGQAKVFPFMPFSDDAASVDRYLLH
jgi:hypothetical protein